MRQASFFAEMEGRNRLMAAIVAKALAGMIAFALARAEVVADSAVSSEIPLGIEAATTYRTDYLLRGSRMAQDVLDFQLQAGYSFDDRSTLDFTAWRVQGGMPTDDRDFTENGIRALRAWQFDHVQVGVEAIWRDQREPVDGDLELGPQIQWQISPDLLWELRLTYLNEISRWYGESNLEWSRALSEKAFWSVQAGLGVAEAFASNNEWHQAGLKFSYSYALLSQVSLVPYVGYSLGLGDEVPDVFHGGIRLQLRF